MPYAELDKDVLSVQNGKEGILIVRDLGDIPGGRTLEVKNVASGTSVIEAGTLIIKNDEGAYEPWDGTSTGKTFVGVLKYGVLVSDPRAAILTMGQVNGKAMPVAPTDEVKAGLPNIQFLYV
jgi:hypothetical protein